MSKMLATLLVVFSTLFWGINFHAGKYVVNYLSAIDGAAIRFTLGAIAVLLILLTTESASAVWKVFKQQWLVFVSLGVIGVAGFNGLFFLGLKHTSAVNGSLIMATNPLVTIVFSAFLLRDRIYLNQYIGMGLSLLGVVLVVTQGNWEMLKHFHIAEGDWIIMGANVCFALYGVLCRRYLATTKPLVTTAITMVIGALCLLFFAYISQSELAWFHQGFLVYAALLHMAFFGTVLAYLFWNSGIVYLGISQTVIFFNLVPVFTVLIAIGLGQPLYLDQLIGGALVLVGVILSTYFSRKEP